MKLTMTLTGRGKECINENLPIEKGQFTNKERTILKYIQKHKPDMVEIGDNFGHSGVNTVYTLIDSGCIEFQR